MRCADGHTGAIARGIPPLPFSLAGRRQQPFDLFSNLLLCAQLSGAGGLQQGLIRHRIPEEVRQAIRNGVLTLSRICAGLHMKQEIRTLEHGLDDHLSAFQEILRAASFHREEFPVARGFIRSQRTAECAQAEFIYESFTAGRIGGASGLAWNEVVGISAAEGVPGQFFGGLTVRFREERRHALPFGLVGEAMDEIFGRELGGRAGFVS